MVMIVVLYPLHVHKRKALSNSYSSFHTPNRCCSRKKPNQDDSEEVIAVELQVLSRRTKVLSNSHPCCDTQYRCCCTKKPNQDDSEEVIVVEFQVLFRTTKML